MKQIFYAGTLLLLSLFMNTVNAQVSCAKISAHPFQTQPGWYGVTVTLDQSYDQSITVNGTIAQEGNHHMDGWQITIAAGSTVAQVHDIYYAGPPIIVVTEITSTSPSTVTKSGVSYSTQLSCSDNEVSVTYAGVTFRYEAGNNILRFNSIQDINTILDQLDLEYENHNNTYENQYSNLTEQELDAMDVSTGFDQFQPFRYFESLLSGFTSKRAEVENTETSWLASGFEGTDPDDIDLTFDDAENTIFNSNYAFKVGSDYYQLTTSGMYKNGVLQATLNKIHKTITGTDVLTPTFAANKNTDNVQFTNALLYETDKKDLEPFTICKSNKKRKEAIEFGSDRYQLKVAINSWFVRSGAKGKVVHYKSEGGSWKRSRAKMAVFCGGTVYNSGCSQSFSFSDRNPSPNGWKKRRQLKVARHQAGAIWKTNSGQLSAAFDTAAGHSASLSLTF